MSKTSKRMREYVYRAKIIKVVDGDTFYARVDLGFGVALTEKFRLARIDTPEIFGANADNVNGHKAKEFVEDAIMNKIVLLRTHKTGKYGRWIAEVNLPNGENLTEMLIENGFEKK